ncbi:MAG: methyltransferase domain-containing protein [Ktedonobacterales bacterium]|nr:methyltransferase domain-containing protein [Ktedonobacterales bacterium]
MAKRAQALPIPASSLAHDVADAEKWSFDAAVVACYDDMLERSIPQYGVMREAVTALAVRFAQPHSTVLDLGCSQGGALAPIIERLGATCSYLGVDSSEPMLLAARQRFAAPIARGTCAMDVCDLRGTYPAVEASVTLAILTLQFIPPEHRQRLVQQMYAHTRPGGVCIVVEKILGSTAAIDTVMVDAYHGLKAANGYTTEQIQHKRASLEGVLMPLTAQWNEDLLRMAGFRQIDCFWRWMNFTGWVAIKDA